MNRLRALQLTLFGLAALIVVLTLVTVTQAVVPMQEVTNGLTGGTPKEVGYAIGAGLAIGVAGCGAGIGMGIVSASAIGAIVEKPEVFGRTMIFVVFIEAIAIYGLVIAIMLIGNIG